MIDFNTYKELHPDSLNFVNEAWAFKRYYKANPNEEARPPELYLFPSLVPGFNFRTKKWSASVPLFSFFGLSCMHTNIKYSKSQG